jgi:hypothetical protein
MGTAYTPGLTVTASTLVERVRRLPIKGDVLVDVGASVEPETLVARALLPGIMQSVKVAAQLGIDPVDLPGALRVKQGDVVTVGQPIAEAKGLFGLFRSETKSPVAGTVETISSVSGSVGIRQPPIPIDVTAYISGTIARQLPGEGVVVESRAALIQGIFGVGRERSGVLRMVSERPDEPLTEASITSEMAGQIIVGGSNLSGDALRKAEELGVAGIVVGGIVDKELIEFLGYDIGVAITGHEKIGTTLIITEGFGTIPMALRTFGLLHSLAGRRASMSGATQIRAGVIRPEVIVPGPAVEGQSAAPVDFSLQIGAPIRIIREPYFGELAVVTALPPQLVTVDSGAQVRVLEARLNDGGMVTVPRANVEIVAG